MENISIWQFAERVLELYPHLRKEAEIQNEKENIIMENLTRDLLEISRITCEMIEKSGKH
ncbi:MAG: hypothetical protein WCX48_08440 [Bacteroidales bacterium]